MSRQIIEAMFDVVEWKHEELAFIECPGKHFHTGKNAKRDCRVNLDNAPTIFCLHSSCSAVIEEANYKMRRAIWDDNPLPKREFSDQEKAKIKRDMDEKRKEQDLKEWAAAKKSSVFEEYHWPIADVFHDSPFMTDDPSYDTEAFLSRMYKPEDVIWNGDVKDSGQPMHRENFRTVKDFLSFGIKGNFTCPSTFPAGTFARKNENVLTRPYLVVESDTLTPDQICSIFKWLSDFLELKAIVYSGGKSFHGWYVFPTEEMFNKLKIILPEMECDEALFKPSQPVRMPGIMRGDKMQCLYWLGNCDIVKF